MTKSIMVAIVLTLLLLAVAGCGGAPTPLPTLLPPPLVAVNPIQAPSPTAIPLPSSTQVPPTATAQATATSVSPTAGATQPTVAPTTGAPSTATPVPATPTNAPTIAPPTPSLPPGLYVSSARLDPPQPAHNQTIAMGVGFLNTANGDQNVKWVVYLYRSDNPTRVNYQSPVNQATFTPGAAPEIDSGLRFKLGATGNQCDYYDAYVDILDINNKGTPLPGIDGQPFHKGFTVCQ